MLPASERRRGTNWGRSRLTAEATDSTSPLDSSLVGLRAVSIWTTLTGQFALADRLPCAMRGKRRQSVNNGESPIAAAAAAVAPVVGLGDFDAPRSNNHLPTANTIERRTKARAQSTSLAAAAAAATTTAQTASSVRPAGARAAAGEAET